MFDCAGSSLLRIFSSGSKQGCAGLSLQRLLLLWSTGSIVAVHRLSCSGACGIFPGHGLNLSLLHWQGIPYHWTTREAPWSLLREMSLLERAIDDTHSLQQKGVIHVSPGGLGSSAPLPESGENIRTGETIKMLVLQKLECTCPKCVSRVILIVDT